MNYTIINEGNDFIVKKADGREKSKPKHRTQAPKSPEEMAWEHMIEEAEQENEERDTIKERNEAYNRAMRGIL